MPPERTKPALHETTPHWLSKQPGTPLGTDALEAAPAAVVHVGLRVGLAAVDRLVVAVGEAGVAGRDGARAAGARRRAVRRAADVAARAAVDHVALTCWSRSRSAGCRRSRRTRLWQAATVHAPLKQRRRPLALEHAAPHAPQLLASDCVLTLAAVRRVVVAVAEARVARLDAAGAPDAARYRRWGRPGMASRCRSRNTCHPSRSARCTTAPAALAGAVHARPAAARDAAGAAVVRVARRVGHVEGRGKRERRRADRRRRRRDDVAADFGVDRIGARRHEVERERAVGAGEDAHRVAGDEDERAAEIGVGRARPELTRDRRRRCAGVALVALRSLVALRAGRARRARVALDALRALRPGRPLGTLRSLQSLWSRRSGGPLRTLGSGRAGHVPRHQRLVPRARLARSDDAHLSAVAIVAAAAIAVPIDLHARADDVGSGGRRSGADRNGRDCRSADDGGSNRKGDPAGGQFAHAASTEVCTKNNAEAYRL